MIHVAWKIDSDLCKDEKKVKSYKTKIGGVNIDRLLDKDENEVLYGRAGYLSGGFSISIVLCWKQTFQLHDLSNCPFQLHARSPF